MSSSLAIRAVDICEAQRATLADWQTQLEKLVQQQCTTPARKVRGSLGVHLASAIRGAHAAIGEACAPAASEIRATAAESINGYFHHPGDARTAAAKFDAFAELRGFLRGWKGEDSLPRLADQAEATAKIITRLLAGQVVWPVEEPANEHRPLATHQKADFCIWPAFAFKSPWCVCGVSTPAFFASARLQPLYAHLQRRFRSLSASQNEIAPDFQPRSSPGPSKHPMPASQAPARRSDWFERYGCRSSCASAPGVARHKPSPSMPQ